MDSLKGSQLTTIQFCIAHLNSIPHHLSSQTKIKTIIIHIYGSMMTFHYGRKSEKNTKQASEQTLTQIILVNSDSKLKGDQGLVMRVLLGEPGVQGELYCTV